MCRDFKYFEQNIEIFMKKGKNTCAWNWNRSGSAGSWSANPDGDPDPYPDPVHNMRSLPLETVHVE
jgi:hypothetical protein